MNKYIAKIKLPEGELESILNELTEAQEKIYECYNKLKLLGIVVIEEEKTISGN